MKSAPNVKGLCAALSQRLSCAVLGPEDAGYSSEVAAFNTAVRHAPDLVVCAESAPDIAEALRFSRENDLRVSVQGAGHGAHAAIPSGLLLSTRRMDSVTVDAQSRTATVGAGARWGAVVSAAAPHGLMPVAGSSPRVGVVGYLLGGGLGPLARSHGFGSDYVEAFTVVTGAGETLQANATQNSELFWALRGGKSGFGIVAQVKLRLAELRTFYAGSLHFEGPHIETVLRAWADWTGRADPRVTTSVAVMRYPQLETLPAPFRGRHLLNLRFAFPGPSEEGQRLAAPLRAFAPLYLDFLSELPVSEVARIHNDPTEPMPIWVRGLMLAHIDPKLLSVLSEALLSKADSPFLAAELRHLGEATQRDVAEGSAVGGRSAAFTFGMAAIVTPERSEAALDAAADALEERLQPWAAPETNINFMGRPRSPDHLATGWAPDTFVKLEMLRLKCDPHGLFAPVGS